MILALFLPSTMTFTFLSSIFIARITLAITPTEKISFGLGLSRVASIWAVRKIILSFSVAISRAWIEEGRPIMNGTRVDG